MSKFTRALPVLVILLALVAGFAYQAKVAKRSQQINWAQCQLDEQGLCQWQQAESTLSLSLPAQPLLAMQQYPIALQAEGLAYSELQILFRGIDMYMGEVKVNLVPVGDGLYQGQVLLPICSQGQMRWQAELLSPDHSIALQFEVESK